MVFSLFLFLDQIGALLILNYFYFTNNNFALKTVCIGLIWEMFHFLNPQLLTILIGKKNQSGVVYPLSHAIWDAVIMLTLKNVITNLHYNNLTSKILIWFFGIIIEILVEYFGNGKIWKYNENLWWNPIIFTYKKQHFTFIPIFEWMFFPILFLISF